MRVERALVVAGDDVGRFIELAFVFSAIEAARFDADENVMAGDHVQSGAKIGDGLIPVIGTPRELRHFLRGVTSRAVHAVAMRVRNISTVCDRRVRGRVVIAQRE